MGKGNSPEGVEAWLSGIQKSNQEAEESLNRLLTDIAILKQLLENDKANPYDEGVSPDTKIGWAIAEVSTSRSEASTRPYNILASYNEIAEMKFPEDKIVIQMPYGLKISPKLRRFAYQFGVYWSPTQRQIQEKKLQAAQDRWRKDKATPPNPNLFMHVKTKDLAIGMRVKSIKHGLGTIYAINEEGAVFINYDSGEDPHEGWQAFNGCISFLEYELVGYEKFTSKPYWIKPERLEEMEKYRLIKLGIFGLKD